MSTTATEVRYTLDQANALLPLLDSIAREIQERRDEQRHLARMRDELQDSHTPEGLTKSLVELDARLYELQIGLRDALGELESLHVEILRLSPLTVHIPGLTQRGEVVFCWQVGEGRVEFGHRIGEEDSPRRPLHLRFTPHSVADRDGGDDGPRLDGPFRDDEQLDGDAA